MSLLGFFNIAVNKFLEYGINLVASSQKCVS